jgi:type 1 glutamine amidotransferase
MAKALILSGGGPYADPWHPFAATSSRLAEIAGSLGYDVETAEQVEERLVDLEDIDVLIVNAAAGPVTAARESALASVGAFLARGGGVLAIHVGASTLIDMPEWEQVTGMAWVKGVSMHPPLGPAHVLVHPERHAIAAPLHDFDLVDERYCHLRLAPDIVPFVSHDHEGTNEPLVWARSYGSARVVTDTFGHDARSFDAPEHRELLLRSLQWIAGTLAAGGAGRSVAVP